jgi:hypothetical protein
LPRKVWGVPAKIIKAISTFLDSYTTDPQSVPPFSGAPSNYLYLPLDDDFMQTIANLLEYVTTWNASDQNRQVYAVEGATATLRSWLQHRDRP